MAATQGLGGQYLRTQEEAKGIIRRSAWGTTYSANTTCTIKSAPPRTPQVLNLLATKSGYLLKRNEQHVWQARWCCVVPHMFLYYFDSPGGGGDGNAASLTPPPNLTQSQQDALNEAVRTGLASGRRQQGPRSTFNIFGSSTATSGAAAAAAAAAAAQQQQADLDDDAVPAATPPGGGSFVPPAGIIDLECYTSVFRSSSNGLVLELSGDESVNPDLRSFYFCADSAKHGDDWTDALLGERHSALRDEKTAYVEVCHSFAQQLQQLHQELDEERHRVEQLSKELYQTRSMAEESRRNGLRMVQDVLDKSLGMGQDEMKQSYRKDLQQARDGKLSNAVQVLCDYTSMLEASQERLTQQYTTLEQEVVSASNKVDATQLEALERDLKKQREKASKQRQILESQLKESRKQIEELSKAQVDARKALASQKMEFTMHASSTKSKLAELTQHKKILKKEVVSLRQQKEDLESELSLQKHTANKVATEMQSERRKAELLERYVEKMENQVKVQQNMMEMMSVGGGGANSVMGGSFVSTPRGMAVGPASPQHNPSVSSQRQSQQQSQQRKDSSLPQQPIVVVNTPSQVDEESLVRQGGETHSVLLRKAMADDVDNKSHMSELTEDRTQRHLDYEPPSQQERSYSGTLMMMTPSSSPRKQSGAQENSNPPFYIGVDHGSSGAMENTRPEPRTANPSPLPPRSGKPSTTSGNDSYSNMNGSVKDRDYPPLRTINQAPQQHHQQSSSSSRRSFSLPISDQRSVGASSLDSGSLNSGRLSVAQRARLEAEQRGSNQVRVRPTANPALPPQHQSGSASTTTATTTTATTSYGATPQQRNRNPSRSRSLQRTPSSSSAGSIFANLGKTLTEAIDNSVLGVPNIEPRQQKPSQTTPNKPQHQRLPRNVLDGASDEDENDISDEDDRRRRSRTNSSSGGRGRYSSGSLNQHEDDSLDSTARPETEITSNVGSSVVGSSIVGSSIVGSSIIGGGSSVSGSTLSLAERQQMQRAQQIAFLKSQGLLAKKDEERMLNRASPRTGSSPGSVASSGFRG